MYEQLNATTVASKLLKSLNVLGKTFASQRPFIELQVQVVFRRKKIFKVALKVSLSVTDELGKDRFSRGGKIIEERKSERRQLNENKDPLGGRFTWKKVMAPKSSYTAKNCWYSAFCVLPRINGAFWPPERRFDLRVP